MDLSTQVVNYSRCWGARSRLLFRTKTPIPPDARRVGHWWHTAASLPGIAFGWRRLPGSKGLGLHYLPQVVHIQWLVMQGYEGQAHSPQLWTTLIGHSSSRVPSWGLCYNCFTVQLLPLASPTSFAPSYRWLIRVLSHKYLDANIHLRFWRSESTTPE